MRLNSTLLQRFDTSPIDRYHDAQNGGLALARSMAELRPGIRIAFMTGHAEREAPIVKRCDPARNRSRNHSTSNG